MPIINGDHIQFYTHKGKYYCHTCGPLRELDTSLENTITTEQASKLPEYSFVYCDDCKELITDSFLIKKDMENEEDYDDDLPF